MRSFTDIVPGVNDKRLIRKLGTKPMSHTSDNWPDESSKKYQKLAFEYAKIYNKFVIENYVN